MDILKRARARAHRAKMNGECGIDPIALLPHGCPEGLAAELRPIGEDAFEACCVDAATDVLMSEHDTLLLRVHRLLSEMTASMGLIGRYTAVNESTIAKHGTRAMHDALHRMLSAQELIELELKPLMDALNKTKTTPVEAVQLNVVLSGVTVATIDEIEVLFFSTLSKFVTSLQMDVFGSERGLAELPVDSWFHGLGRTIATKLRGFVTAMVRTNYLTVDYIVKKVIMVKLVALIDNELMLPDGYDGVVRFTETLTAMCNVAYKPVLFRRYLKPVLTHLLRQYRRFVDGDARFITTKMRDLFGRFDALVKAHPNAAGSLQAAFGTAVTARAAVKKQYTRIVHGEVNDDIMDSMASLRTLEALFKAYDGVFKNNAVKIIAKACMVIKWTKPTRYVAQAQAQASYVESIHGPFAMPDNEMLLPEQVANEGSLVEKAFAAVGGVVGLGAAITFVGPGMLIGAAAQTVAGVAMVGGPTLGGMLGHEYASAATRWFKGSDDPTVLNMATRLLTDVEHARMDQGLKHEIKRLYDAEYTPMAGKEIGNPGSNVGQLLRKVHTRQFQQRGADMQLVIHGKGLETALAACTLLQPRTAQDRIEFGRARNTFAQECAGIGIAAAKVAYETVDDNEATKSQGFDFSDETKRMEKHMAFLDKYITPGNHELLRSIVSLGTTATLTNAKMVYQTGKTLDDITAGNTTAPEITQTEMSTALTAPMSTEVSAALAGQEDVGPRLVTVMIGGVEHLVPTGGASIYSTSLYGEGETSPPLITIQIESSTNSNGTKTESVVMQIGMELEWDDRILTGAYLPLSLINAAIPRAYWQAVGRAEEWEETVRQWDSKLGEQPMSTDKDYKDSEEEDTSGKVKVDIGDPKPETEEETEEEIKNKPEENAEAKEANAAKPETDAAKAAAEAEADAAKFYEQMWQAITFFAMFAEVMEAMPDDTFVLNPEMVAKIKQVANTDLADAVALRQQTHGRVGRVWARPKSERYGHHVTGDGGDE